MKSVLISIRPKWCEKIASGEKTIEVRKTAPKEVPFKAYIYCSYGDMKTNYYLKGICKVIGEFICDKVYSIKNQGNSFVVANEEQGVTNEIARQSCLDYYDMVGYLGDKDGYGLHITDLKIYDKPKPIMQFYKPCPIKIKNCPVCELYSTYTGCCMNNIDRPPQSYMFVEDV